MDTKIIAEIGINHNGDLNIAEKLIKKSALAGADFVKFQKRNPDVCVPESQKNKLRDTPWGKLKYIDYKKKIEFGKEEYDYLYKIAEDNNIELFFSIWDEDSLNFVLQYESEYIKIPSALCTKIDLIQSAKESGRTIIISTGMTPWNDILNIIKIFHDRPNQLILMHCVSEYPPSNSYLGTINELKKIHNRIGYSSHDVGNEIPLSTLLLDIEMIEKHVTIDTKMWGSDQHISSDMNELSLLVKHKNIILFNDKIKSDITTNELKYVKRQKG